MEEPLLQRVARGDQDAVRACLDRFGGLVWSLARRMTPTHAEAEDAVQEIFVEIWKNAHRYDASVASETAFIAMIARRRLIDRRRRSGRLLDKGGFPEAEPPAGDAGEMSADEREVANAAMSAMSRLSDDQQRVLRLSLVQGLSHERIAGATGLPLGTVKTHARRGLIRLRELLSAAKRDADGTGGSSEGGAA
ncbi:MAG: sigma-70 family RNA polymerase sigma factor [Phycisphaerales bacterium]|nr:sigma-70 family RNA polymerase sigma factor [Phycisphaerales bacterium]